jgi:hypothetical protein
MRKFSFASVNMRRRNAAMHALLNDNGEDDLLCVQEPWFNPVGTARCDDMIQGKDVLGGAANPKWRLAYPSLTNGQRAKVMTYVWLHDRFAKFKPNHCQMIVHNNLASHPCLLISDIRLGTYYWHVINFYNDVADPSALDALVGLDLDATIPTLLVGDFNLHSPSWSPMGWDTSCGAHRLEEWAAAQTLDVTDLQGPPSERTPEEKLWDFKTCAQQYARDRESHDDVQISYLEFLETEAEDDLALARMIAG